jgi:hypothetical protein
VNVETADIVIGIGFAVVFVSYGFALRQRLLTLHAAVTQAWAELHRRRANGLADADAARAYDEAAEALNDVIARFPSNRIARLMKIETAPLVGDASVD